MAITEFSDSLLKELFIEHFKQNLKEALMIEASRMADEAVEKALLDVKKSLEVYMFKDPMNQFIKIIVEKTTKNAVEHKVVR